MSVSMNLSRVSTFDLDNLDVMAKNVAQLSVRGKVEKRKLSGEDSAYFMSFPLA
jgi:hypothetical protein